MSTISVVSVDDGKTYPIYCDAIFIVNSALEYLGGTQSFNLKIWTKTKGPQNAQPPVLFFGDLAGYNTTTELVNDKVLYFINWTEIIASSSSTSSSSHSSYSSSSKSSQSSSSSSSSSEGYSQSSASSGSSESSWSSI